MRLLILLTACVSCAPTSSEDSGDDGCVPVAERCDNGADDDCNGLADCEDMACLDVEACVVEDCNNLTDDDGDARIDCADDECWNSTDCLGRRPIVDLAGGTLTHQLTVDGWRTVDSFEAFTSSTVTMDQVSGVLRVLPAGQTWADHTTSTTCAWSFASGEGRYLHDMGQYYAGDSFEETTDPDIARTGFTIEPGCGTADDGFLPANVYGYRGRATFSTPSVWKTVPTAFWYDGAPVGPTDGCKLGGWNDFDGPQTCVWTLDIAPVSQVR